MKTGPRASDWEATYPVHPWRWFGSILGAVAVFLLTMGLIGFLANGA